MRADRVIIICALVLLAAAVYVQAAPVGPTVTYSATETAPTREAALINTSGGSITTMVLNATTQNLRWKAFVGNVTGSLTLDDAENYTVFDWSLSSVIGEVYATRSSDTVTWSNINCSNATHILNEEMALNHISNPDDNISTTFSVKDHEQFYVGTRLMTTDSCFSLHTYVNDAPQSADFEEVVLYDGTNHTNGDVVYATPLEQDVQGFDTASYDFQMIVPENGLATWQSSTAYYFYVELT